jgi:acid phosphatase type 7
MIQEMRLVRISLSVVLTVCTLSTLASAEDLLTAPKLTRGPYVQLSTPSSVSIIWRTVGETQPVVRYGSNPANLDHTVADASILVRKVLKEGEASNDLSLHSAPEGTVQYDATFTGLEPGTTYYYAIGNGATTLAGGDSEHFFRTHPEPGKVKPVRIWVVGDSGTSDARQATVYQAMREHVTKQNHPLDLYVHVGDMAYPSGTDEEFQKKFFGVYQPTLQNTVCWASMGNHEGKTSKGLLGVGPYYDAYVCPKRGESVIPSVGSSGDSHCECSLKSLDTWSATCRILTISPPILRLLA